jgi:16S rRNA (uracil1498-N3)-methyltransferase
MPIERFFLPETFKETQETTVEGQEFHHMAHAMRIKEGQEIELINGLGQLAKGKVTSLQKRSATVEICEILSEEKRGAEFILAQAIPRINRLDYIIEKGTELGMTQLWLFPGERSERKELSIAQQERAQAIAIAAMKQCGRLFLPLITLKPALVKWDAPKSAASFFGDLDSRAPYFANLKIDQKQNLLFYVGPESGFSEKEENFLREFLKAEGVKLHNNILRTDTAALVALTLMTTRV